MPDLALASPDLSHPLAWLLLGVGGAIAGFLNVVAGGGSLLTIPLLIFLGVDPTTANGTNRIAIAVQNVSAVSRYHREKAIDWGATRFFVLPAIFGAALGAWVGAGLEGGTFRTLLGWLTLGAAGVVALDLRRLVDRPTGPHTRHTPATWLLMFGIGIYGGMIQAGVGYLLLAALTLGAGMDLVRANVLKVVLVLAYVPVTIVLFASRGHVIWSAAAVLALGQATGAWLGAGAALKRGEKLIRAVLAVVVLATAVALLVG